MGLHPTVQCTVCAGAALSHIKLSTTHQNDDERNTLCVCLHFGFGNLFHFRFDQWPAIWSATKSAIKFFKFTSNFNHQLADFHLISIKSIQFMAIIIKVSNFKMIKHYCYCDVTYFARFDQLTDHIFRWYSPQWTRTVSSSFSIFIKSALGHRRPKVARKSCRIPIETYGQLG